MSGLKFAASAIADEAEVNAPTTMNSARSMSTSASSISGLSSTHRSLFSSEQLLRSEDSPTANLLSQALL